MKVEIIKLKCECGADFERENVPEEWKSIITVKWLFKYCDTCRKKKIDEALKHLPYVVNSLLNSDQNVQESDTTEAK